MDSRDIGDSSPNIEDEIGDEIGDETPVGHVAGTGDSRNWSKVDSNAGNTLKVNKTHLEIRAERETVGF